MNADVAAVVNFLAQVRRSCQALAANPFNVDSGELMLDLLLESAPLAEEALIRVARDGTVLEQLLKAVHNVTVQQLA